MSADAAVEVHDLHQIVLADESPCTDRWPAGLQRNADEAQRLYPKARYRRWSTEMLREFISSRFDQDVLRVFDNLGSPEIKADLGRCCLLQHFGGLCIEPSVLLLNVWTIPPASGAAGFRPPSEEMQAWIAISTDLLWSQAGRREWGMVIDWIVGHGRATGAGAVYPAGIGGHILGKAFAAVSVARGQTPEADDQWIGEVRLIAGDTAAENVGFVAPDRLLVALRTTVRVR